MESKNFTRRNCVMEKNTAIIIFSDNNFEELFDFQIQTLKERGVCEDILDMLQSKKDIVIRKARKTRIGEGNIPFLPILPNLPFHSQIPMVWHDGRTGQTHSRINEVTDIISVPSIPYYIFDIEDGSVTKGVPPLDARMLIREQKRCPLTFSEIIGLAIHTDVFSRHSLWASGSCDSFTMVPFIYLNGHKVPEICWGYADDADQQWGSPVRARTVVRTSAKTENVAHAT